MGAYKSGRPGERVVVYVNKSLRDWLRRRNPKVSVRLSILAELRRIKAAAREGHYERLDGDAVVRALEQRPKPTGLCPRCERIGMACCARCLK